MKPFNATLISLTQASGHLQRAYETLRAAGQLELAKLVMDSGVAVQAKLNDHVISHGVQQAQSAEVS